MNNTQKTVLSPNGSEHIKVGKTLRAYSMVIALVVIAVLFHFLTDGLIFTAMNLTNLILQNSYVVLLILMLDFDGLEGAALEAAQAECVLAKVGSAIAWIFAPLGWTKAGNGWKMAVAAVSGLIAKENVVATFGQLFGFAEVAEDGSEIWKSLSLVMTPVAAYGFLVFNLLCAPCFAAMGAIKREMNNVKWFWFAIGYQCILAYIVSLCIYQIGTLITVGTFGVGTVVAFLLIIGFIYLLFRPYKESNTLNFDAKKTVSAK